MSQCAGKSTPVEKGLWVGEKLGRKTRSRKWYHPINLFMIITNFILTVCGFAASTVSLLIAFGVLNFDDQKCSN